MTAATSSAGRHPSVAVIGAGTMGSPVARRLLHAGFPVAVWNRTAAAAAALTADGATNPPDVTAAVASSDVVITFLPTGQAVRDVMIDGGAVAAMAPGSAWVQMGTLGVETTDALRTVVHTMRPDVAFVDAPVSGSRRPAETGQLLVLASGPEAAKVTVQPVFDVLARRTLWLGPAGAGSRLKLALNTWLAFEVEAVAEAAAVADRLGVPAQTLADAATGNPVASPLALAKLAKIQAGDHRAEFPLAWALKDLDLARSEAGTAATPIGAAIAERWRELVDAGLGADDVSAAASGLGIAAGRRAG